MYEYSMLVKIMSANSTCFEVPKAFGVIGSSSSTFLIMERVRGCELEDYVVKLLFNDAEALKAFYMIEVALRELHTLNLDELRSCSLPSSNSEIKTEVVELAEKLLEVNKK
ncbi:hypothetical protein KEJ27_10010 [Candidatus Bathyarchaeota archaeon]|nr:hypothetical protein [Candidatus Bathyarchaeota archaeon]